MAMGPLWGLSQTGHFLVISPEIFWSIKSKYFILGNPSKLGCLPLLFLVDIKLSQFSSSNISMFQTRPSEWASQLPWAWSEWGPGLWTELDTMEDGREAAEEWGDCLRGEEWAHPRPGQDHPLPRPADQAEAPPGVYWQGQSLLAKVFFTLRCLALYQAFSDSFLDCLKQRLRV